MNQFSYIRPSSQKAAIDAVSKDASARFIAGGTNLLDLMKNGVMIPEKLVDINRLTLKEVQLKNGVLHIGALALNSELAAHDLVKTHHPLLSEALLAGASQQLRNMATVGGNMMQRTRCTYFYDTAMPCNKRSPGSGCGAIGGINRMHAIFGASDHCIAVHPSDMCVALAALDATALVSGPKGDRRIPFTDFHRLPGDTPQLDNNLGKGELITAVEIPSNPFTKNVYYLTVRDRASYAFANVSVAAVIGDGFQHFAFGGLAHKPWRVEGAEREAGADAISAAVLAGARTTPQNDYKTILTRRTLGAVLREARA